MWFSVGAWESCICSSDLFREVWLFRPETRYCFVPAHRWRVVLEEIVCRYLYLWTLPNGILFASLKLIECLSFCIELTWVVALRWLNFLNWLEWLLWIELSCLFDLNLADGLLQLLRALHTSREKHTKIRNTNVRFQFSCMLSLSSFFFLSCCELRSDWTTSFF